MSALDDRYAALVAALPTGLASIDDAERLAAEGDSTWLRAMASALAASARAMSGGALDVEAIVDAAPPASPAHPARLDELLPGGGTLAKRLADHGRATAVPPEALRPIAERLLRVLRRRAHEDLDLPEEESVELETVTRPAEPWRGRLVTVGRASRLVLNHGVTWTAASVLHTVAGEAYPGRHLTRLLRPPAPTWSPSPETTVDDGLRAVGREILLADHELAHELHHAGRAAGLAWEAELVVAVARAVDERAPAIARAAMADDDRDPERELARLGLDAAQVQRCRERWRDPLERAAAVGRAAGPPLVRDWLVTTGQTAGLQRLLSERLVPSQLRREVAGGAP